MRVPNLLLFAVGLIFIIVSCKKTDTVKEQDSPPPPNLSSDKAIISFVIKVNDNSGLLVNDTANIYANDTIMLTVPYGLNLNVLKPTITHTGLSISPNSGIAQNFSTPVNYKVKAVDGSSIMYTVITKVKIKSTVFITNTSGKLLAIDGEDGSIKWTYTATGGITTASPAYFNGTVYFGSADKYMYAIDASNGALKWRFLASGSLQYNTPCINNGILYFGGILDPYSRGALFALNASTGSLLWNYQQHPYWLDNPTVSNGKVFITSFGGLHSFNATNGNSIMNYNGSICGINPLVKGNFLYSGTEGTTISAFDIQSGFNIWNFSDANNGIKSASTKIGATMHNGTIFATGSSKYMYAIDSATGTLKWRYILDGGANSGFFSSPYVANSMVYAGNSDSYIYAIDEITGNLKWKFRNFNATNLPPGIAVNNCTVKDDIVYVAYADGFLYALNAFDGSVIWKSDIGAPTYSGPCILKENGTILNSGLSGEKQ